MQYEKNIIEESISTEVTEEDIKAGIADEFGVIYSPDGKRLLDTNREITDYSVKPGCKVICDLAFSFCKVLQSISLPDSLTSIGDSAFSSCISLQSISLPDTLTSIGDSAFYECDFLPQEIKDRIRLLNSRAFDRL